MILPNIVALFFTERTRGTPLRLKYVEFSPYFAKTVFDGGCHSRLLEYYGDVALMLLDDRAAYAALAVCKGYCNDAHLWEKVFFHIPQFLFAEVGHLYRIKESEVVTTAAQYALYGFGAVGVEVEFQSRGHLLADELEYAFCAALVHLVFKEYYAPEIVRQVVGET